MRLRKIGRRAPAIVFALAAASAAAAFSPYGVVTDGSRSEYEMHEDLADLIKVGGMGYERVDWDWRACQKEKDGPFDFSKYDKLLDDAEARGITVLPIIYGPPRWATPAWQHLDGYAAFVRETVRRYGKRMPVIEIWNEQNLAGFWKNPNPTNYVALLKAAYKAAKEADPSVRVAMGGVAGWGYAFVRPMYAAGAKDYFDIVNVHPYCYQYGSSLEQELRHGFAWLRKTMADYGDAAKPIWFTEIGWPTHDLNLSGGGNVLVAGLKVARPEKTAWNVIYAACVPDATKPDQKFARNIEEQLPPGSKAVVCGPKETCELLAAGGWDAVVYPSEESYPADTLEAVVEFVRKGGTLVDLGGMPMWNSYRNLPDGSSQTAKFDGSWERFKRLKIGLDSWWLPGSELPKNAKLAIRATEEGRAAGVKHSPEGIRCSHFFDARELGPEDRMVPLLAAENPNNGKPAVGACVYLLDGDMKGRVVVSGENYALGGRTTEFQQGVYYARAMGFSFAEGVEAFFWYSLRARERDRFYCEHHFGMVHANLVPKPGWIANKTFITQRPAGSKNLGGEWRRDGLYFPQWMRPNGEVCGMVWNDRGEKAVTLEFDADEVVFHDVWGKLVYPKGTGRTWKVMLTGEPLYFTGAKLLSVK